MVMWDDVRGSGQECRPKFEAAMPSDPSHPTFLPGKWYVHTMYRQNKHPVEFGEPGQMNSPLSSTSQVALSAEDTTATVRNKTWFKPIINRHRQCSESLLSFFLSCSYPRVAD